MLNQYLDLSEKFVQKFNSSPEIYVVAPGRTELGGNHTDHNGGHVLAASINLATRAVVAPVMDYRVTFFSEGFHSRTIDISNLDRVAEETNTSASIVRGMAASIAKRGGCLGGFNAYITSEVMAGSGLSSSAAFEVLIGKIFSTLFNDDKFSSTELAIMGKEAENDYFGKPSGLMDQVACANGGVVGIDFKDANHPVIKDVKADFKSWGYDLVIVNTPTSHADLTETYAAIPGEMKMVANYFGKDRLVDVDPDLFEKEKDNILKKIGNERAVLRAHHFFTEDKRAVQMFDALKANDRDLYMHLVRESGKSSQLYLQNIGALQEVLDISNDFLGDRGVARVHGGGFAGAIQAYVPSGLSAQYTGLMENKYGKGCVTEISIRNTGVTSEVF